MQANFIGTANTQGLTGMQNEDQSQEQLMGQEGQIDNYGGETDEDPQLSL